MMIISITDSGSCSTTTMEVVVVLVVVAVAVAATVTAAVLRTAIHTIRMWPKPADIVRFLPLYI
jgi:hypothetical protein